MDIESAEEFANSTLENETDHMSLPAFIIFEITFVIFCIIGICTDMVLVYMVYRFKKLQTPFYIILANWAIADIYPLIVSPLEYGLYPFVDYKSVGFYIITMYYGVVFILYNASIIFIACLGTDWLLASYFPNSSKTYQKYQKYIFGTVWCGVLLSLCAFIILGFQHNILGIPLVTMFFLLVGLSLFMVALHITRWVQKCRLKSSDHPRLSLMIVTVFVVCWISRCFDHFVDAYLPFLRLVSSLTSTIFFVMIYRENKDFQACFCQVWKRSGGRYVDEIPEASMNFQKNGDSVGQNDFQQVDLNQS